MPAELISQPESKTLEFKRDLSSPAPLLRTLVAFANSAGGQLVVGVEDMKQGVSQLRNPVIARVFRELELVEQWGSGIPGIFRQAAAAKLVEPTIEELAGRVRFTVFLPEILPLSREKARGSTGAGPESRPESGVESGVESEMAVDILTKLRDGPLSKAEIARSLGKPKPTRYLNDLMVKLLREKLVAYTIPEKPNSRLQKYRLTNKGQDLLNSLEQR